MKAQVSTEFIVMVMAATVMITIFLVAFSELYGDNLQDKKEILAEDYGYSLQNEFLMAAQASSGYTRTFTIPTKLEGFSYEVKIIGTVLIVNYSENIFNLPIPASTGVLKKGENTITKINNTICVNC